MQENTKKESFISWKTFFLVLAIAFVCRQFLFVPTIVKGESMAHTFENNNGVIVSKTSKIDRFDFIVFKAPDSNETYIKRVIGLPGDHIMMKDDVLYINGEKYEENYVNRAPEGFPLAQVTEDFTLEEKTGESQVPEGHLFVMGDNRSKSNDSRFFGFIEEDSVIGEVKVRFYPFNEFSIW